MQRGRVGHTYRITGHAWNTRFGTQAVVDIDNDHRLPCWRGCNFLFLLWGFRGLVSVHIRLSKLLRRIIPTPKFVLHIPPLSKLCFHLVSSPTISPPLISLSLFSLSLISPLLISSPFHSPSLISPPFIFPPLVPSGPLLFPIPPLQPPLIPPIPIIIPIPRLLLPPKPTSRFSRSLIMSPSRGSASRPISAGRRGRVGELSGRGATSWAIFAAVGEGHPAGVGGGRAGARFWWRHGWCEQKWADRKVLDYFQNDVDISPSTQLKPTLDWACSWFQPYQNVASLSPQAKSFWVSARTHTASSPTMWESRRHWCYQHAPTWPPSAPRPPQSPTPSPPLLRARPSRLNSSIISYYFKGPWSGSQRCWHFVPRHSIPLFPCSRRYQSISQGFHGCKSGHWRLQVCFLCFGDFTLVFELHSLYTGALIAQKLQFSCPSCANRLSH